MNSKFFHWQYLQKLRSSSLGQQRARCVFTLQVSIHTQVGMSVHLLFSTFLMNINRTANQLICNNGVTVTFKHKSAFLLYLFIHCSTVRFLLLEKAATQCYIVLVWNESEWVVPLSKWIPVTGLFGFGSSLYCNLVNKMEICPHQSLNESHLLTSSKNSTTQEDKKHFPFYNFVWVSTQRMEERIEVVFTRAVCSLSLAQTGCTLVGWYFGFPQQQQWTQDSTIKKRNVATNRMSTKNAPSSRGLACGRLCSLVHNFWRISIISSFTSMLTLRCRSHTEIWKSASAFRKGNKPL